MLKTCISIFSENFPEILILNLVASSKEISVKTIAISISDLLVTIPPTWDPNKSIALILSFNPSCKINWTALSISLKLSASFLS